LFWVGCGLYMPHGRVACYMILRSLCLSKLAQCSLICLADLVCDLRSSRSKLKRCLLLCWKNEKRARCSRSHQRQLLLSPPHLQLRRLYNLRIMHVHRSTGLSCLAFICFLCRWQVSASNTKLVLITRRCKCECLPPHDKPWGRSF
jgi:hypothetical protein